MLRATGLDQGQTGSRYVSVGVLWGKPQVEKELPLGGSVIANVPSDKLTFRTISVPKAGRDIQGRIVREELGFSLPFPLEEAAWDWIAQEETAVVAVALNSQLLEVRNRVGQGASLDAEAFSYLRAAGYADVKDALIFDFGASRTTVCALKGGLVDWVRVSFMGGNSLDKTIAAQLDKDLQEMPQEGNGLKLPRAFEDLLNLAEERARETLDDEPVPECLNWIRQEAANCHSASQLRELPDYKIRLQEIAREFKHREGCSLETCRHWLKGITASALLSTPVPFDQILICGGGAAMPGLDNELTGLLGQKVIPFPLPEPLDYRCHVAAFGAALAGKLRQKKIELMPTLAPEQKLNHTYLVYLLIFLVVATCDLELRYNTVSTQCGKEAAVIKTSVKELAPDLAEKAPDVIASELTKRSQNNLNIMLRSPENLLETLAGFGRPMRTLQGLEIRNMDYKEDSSGQAVLSIEGIAQDLQQIEEFRKSLETSLDKPELVESRAGAGSSTRFTIEGGLLQK